MSQLDIFYVLNSRFPTIKAYGLQVAKTCEGLKRAGSRVRLIVPMRKIHKEIQGKTWQELYNIRDSVRLIRLPSLDLTWLGVNGKIFFAIQQFGFAVLARLYLIRKRGIVYSRDQFVLYLLSFFNKKPLFWEVHRLPERMDLRVYKRLLAKLSGIVVISHGLKERLSKIYGPVRILVAPDGIDLEEFNTALSVHDARSRLGLSHDKIIIMYVGHLFEWKGVDVLIEAAQGLGSDFEVVVVGGAQEDIARLRSRDMRHRVRFEGFKNHTEIPRYLSAADIVVLPNKKDGDISEFYTSPLKMFEYMAMGKAIIASDLPSIREVLNESNAILITPGNATVLRQTIQELARDPEKMQRLGTRARHDALQYSWHIRGTLITDFINHAISR